MKRKTVFTLLLCLVGPSSFAQIVDQEAISLQPASNTTSVNSVMLPESDSLDVGGGKELVQQRYPSGKVHVERWVTEDGDGNLVNHGAYVRYNAQGDAIVSGRYDMGKRVGDWSKQLSANEAKQLSGSALAGFKPSFTSKASFENGKLQGDWICSDAEGKLAFVWTFAAGKRNGVSTTFNAKNEIVRSVSYRNDLVNGPATVALNRTQAPTEVQFENGRMLRQVDQHYPTKTKGVKRLKSQDWYLVATPLNVESSNWESNLVAYQKVSKGDMVRHGRSITYFENGQRNTEGHYVRGAKSGKFVWWYSNGQRKTIGEYEDDKETGQWTWWHENGMRQASGTFALGEKVDEWSVWNPNGKLVERTHPSSSRIALKPDSPSTAIK